MPSRQRYRSGPSAPVRSRIQGGTGLIFSVGDLVYQAAGYVLPASQLANAALATFDSNFLGVLKNGATVGTETLDQNVLVEATGDHEYDLATPAATASPEGTFMGVATGATNLLNQTVVVVAAQAQAIGALAKPIAVGDTTIRLTSVPSRAWKGVNTGGAGRLSVSTSKSAFSANHRS